MELSDSFFLQNKEHVNSQFIWVDATIASRNDAVLTFKFNFENLKDSVEVNIIDPTGKKHELKSMDKCLFSRIQSLLVNKIIFESKIGKDSSLIQKERSYDKTKKEVVCQFESPAKGKWIFNILSPMDQEFYVKLKVFVFFQRFEELQSYYPNYYASKKFDKRETKKRLKKNAVAAAHDAIQFDAKWSRQSIYYPSDSQVVYASISRNLQPIINATVRAIIYRPTGDYISLELYDNGLNADRYANDGVYTRYFTNFNFDGVYFARVNFICVLILFYLQLTKLDSNCEG